MNRYYSLLILMSFLALGTFFATSTVVAWSPGDDIVPCGFNANDECEICDIVRLGTNVIAFLVFASVLVAALLFVNAGVLYIFSAANPANIARAHKIFTSALIGFLIVLSAWLIINVIMYFLFTSSPLATFVGGAEWFRIVCP